MLIKCFPRSTPTVHQTRKREEVEQHSRQGRETHNLGMQMVDMFDEFVG
jgi:hypothetical protein